MELGVNACRIKAAHGGAQLILAVTGQFSDLPGDAETTGGEPYPFGCGLSC